MDRFPFSTFVFQTNEKLSLYSENWFSLLRAISSVFARYNVCLSTEKSMVLQSPHRGNTSIVRHVYGGLSYASTWKLWRKTWDENATFSPEEDFTTGKIPFFAFFVCSVSVGSTKNVPSTRRRRTTHRFQSSKSVQRRQFFLFSFPLQLPRIIILQKNQPCQDEIHCRCHRPFLGFCLRLCPSQCCCYQGAIDGNECVSVPSSALQKETFHTEWWRIYDANDEWGNQSTKKGAHQL